MDIAKFLRESPTPICLSGGAIGADVTWGRYAKQMGHRVLHWSCEGHRTKAASNEVIRLTRTQLTESDQFVKRANVALQRTFPSNIEMVNNLLRRNRYQVAWTDAVYAVGKMRNSSEVDGGTAWAVQMYIDRFLHDNEDMSNCHLYFFDERQQRWLKWHHTWAMCEYLPPIPTGIWTGIGTRKITKDGQNEIERVTVKRPSEQH